MNSLPSKPPCHYPDALEVLRRLREQGHVAYFAGGCVRDLLLGMIPKDWDVATDAPPKRVRELFAQTQAVGQAFGVILVKVGHSTVEVATFRSDGAYTDGRRPDSVHFTNAQEDAQRRDFTINGLFLDPLPAADAPTSAVRTKLGIVIDYVGGVADLHARTLRAIGDPHRRFAEDHLRLLRAVRFAARFDLAIDPATKQAIRTNAPRLRGISPERIGDELRLTLTPPTRAFAWPMLWELALVDVIFRLLPSQEGAEFDARTSLLLKISPGDSIPFALALAAAVLDYRLQPGASADPLPLAAPREIQRAGKALREAMKLSNDELEDFQGILAPLPMLLGDAYPSVAAKKRFLARPTSAPTRALLQAFAALGFHGDRIARLEPELAELVKTEVAPEPLLTGDDLVANGYRPGPAFKKILDAVYDAQLEGRIASQSEGLALARSLHLP